MAILDRDKGQIVIRIAYDGPALSGKTTSVKALSRSLGRAVFSAGEAEGRTLFFDWMDYAGGRFEGHEIRCQVVSVPGQTVLQKRRQKLIAAADAIVFVADGTTGGLVESLQTFRSLLEHLTDRPGPRVGVIVQANKRDMPGSIPIEELRIRLATTEMVAITESVATQGTGVRETFIFAVRLALDRVRDLIQSKSLEVGRPEIDSEEDLLHELRSLDGEPESPPHEPDLPPGSALSADLARVFSPALRDASEQTAPRTWEVAPDAPDQRPPRPPDATVASGMVWPPVDGRLILHEAGSAGFAPERTAAGDWSDEGSERWRLHSARGDWYASLDEGRDALIRWARAHTAAAPSLSPYRCVVLSEAVPGVWRLWQIVQKNRSLHALLARAAWHRPAADVAALLLEASRLIVEASVTLMKELSEDASIVESITPVKSMIVFIGLMPSPSERRRKARIDRSPRALVRRELQTVTSQIRQTRAQDVASIIDSLKHRAVENDQREIADTLAAMLLQQ